MEAGRRGGGGKHSVVHACTTGMDVGKCAWSHRPLRMEERSRLTNSLAYLGEIYTRVGLRPTPRFKLSPCLRFGVLRVCVEMPPSPHLPILGTALGYAVQFDDCALARLI